MTDELLQQAIALAQAGRKSEALPLLEEVLMASPKNEIAWLWLADCQPTLDERIEVLETFVQAVPEAKRALSGLAALRRARDKVAAAPGIVIPGEVLPQEDTTQSSSFFYTGPLSQQAPEVQPDAGEPVAEGSQDEWPELRESTLNEAWLLESAPGELAAGGTGGIPAFDGDYDEIDIEALLGESKKSQEFPAVEEMAPAADAFAFPAEEPALGNLAAPEDLTGLKDHPALKDLAAPVNQPAIRPIKAQQIREKEVGKTQPRKGKLAPPKNGKPVVAIVLLVIAIITLLGVAAFLIAQIYSSGGF